MNACHCTPADHDYELRRDILPQRPALVDENLARQLFAGSYPSVFFGRGLSIDALSRTNNFEEIANMMRDPGWDKPFDQVRVGNDHKILVKVNWPDHDPLDTAHGEYVPLEAANRPGIPSTKAQLALLVGQVVMRAMERVKNNRPGDHRCWAVSTNEEDGLTKRCVYLYAIHHVGGFTYQPELQV
ncbi:uncharacterized protein B0H18DRAFT_1110111 [Fomitopsis serialis]|uniref:uncharacterized protein n=1 Tax=Fomitopsis serialis TaxID=139415 RepID=UPI0020087A5E|nr:uncharacterized protein B0H18DRAFT_1110111 [Neoantrodia serialis]KAH9911494.1 hypothetical protein B0H18DRAFT_1110111 [Neoantrodia serialis]